MTQAAVTPQVAPVEGTPRRTSRSAEGGTEHSSEGLRQGIEHLGQAINEIVRELRTQGIQLPPELRDTAKVVIQGLMHYNRSDNQIVQGFFGWNDGNGNGDGAGSGPDHGHGRARNPRTRVADGAGHPPAEQRVMASLTPAPANTDATRVDDRSRPAPVRDASDHMRTSNRSNEHYDYNTEKTAYLSRFTGDQRTQAEAAVRAMEGRMATNKPPLSRDEAARVLHDFQTTLEHPERLTSAMGANPLARAQQVSIAYLNDMAHSLGTDSQVRQHIGSCGVMGLNVDLLQGSPSIGSRVLGAAMTARPDIDHPGMLVAHVPGRDGRDGWFAVDPSFMQMRPGTPAREAAQQMLHGSLTNLMWNQEGYFYTLGTPGGQGENGARLHWGSFGSNEVMMDGNKPVDNPMTTLEALARIDRRLDAGTQRVYSGRERASSLGPNFTNLAEHRGNERQMLDDAMRRGGGTVQMEGAGAIWMGINGAGRDTYHNATLSNFDGNYVYTDTNGWPSNDHYNVNVALAGINNDDNADAAAYREWRRVHGPNNQDADFGMKHKEPDDIKKNDDKQTNNRGQRDQLELEERLALAARQKQAAQETRQRMMLAGEDVPESVRYYADLDLGSIT